MANTRVVKSARIRKYAKSRNQSIPVSTKGDSYWRKPRGYASPGQCVTLMKDGIPTNQLGV